MATRTNYDDNIFYIQTIIKTLKSAVTLDVDGEYFRDKVVEDIFFVDGILLRILTSLRDNPHLIHRVDYLRSLLRAKTAFVEFLDDLIEAKTGLSTELTAYMAKLKNCRTSNRKDIAEIHTLLSNGDSVEPAEDLVSQEEFRFLLEDQEEADEEEP